MHTVKHSIILFFAFFLSSLTIARPLNILCVLGHFPAPSQTFILNQIIGLLDLGHNVRIFSFAHDEYTTLDPKINEYELFDRLIKDDISSNFPECDIVLCQFGYLGKRILEMLDLKEWLQDKKIVTCLRGSDITAHIAKKPHAYDLLFERGDLFLPVCEFLKNRLLAVGCNEDRVKVHYSAIDCSQFNYKERIIPINGVVRFISVCRLVEKKGIEFAIKAFAKVIKKYPRALYVIVGDGPERPYLEKLIKKLHLQNNVTIAGWKAQKEVAILLDQSHIFVLPSITASDGNEEGIPNALKEAMATGMPVIATYHAGNEELIENDVSGYLVPQKDVSELSKKMKRVIEHPDDWVLIGANARNTVENRFEKNKNVEQLEVLFYDLLDEASDVDG